MNADRERVVAHLSAAIQRMRAAADEAERAVQEREPLDATRRVMHLAAWGWANASGSVESAMSALRDAHAISADSNGQPSADALDAKRYRHLRNKPQGDFVVGADTTLWDADGFGEKVRGGALDAAVDAEIAAQEKTP